MKFRTEINFSKSDILIEHQDRIVTIGSCFAENIADYFKYYRFDVLDNPFGVLYNPVSIYNAVKLLSGEKIFIKDNLVYDQGEWHSFYHHSDYSHHNADECLLRINTGLAEARKFIKESRTLIITFGTSYVYKHLSDDLIVSNCHKIKADKFDRFRLTIDEAKKHILLIINLVEELNKNLKIIFTVSPVRHWKDGAVDNQLSKSILLLALNESIGGKENCVYFPSYEIMMDDLRDYRFYESDLVHPNKTATDYIWHKFSDAHLSVQCKNILTEIEPIAKARLHRARNIFSEANKHFVKNQLKRIEELEKNYKHLKLSDDKEYFQNINREIDKQTM